MSMDHRVYLSEPGWHPVIKLDAGRFFCHLADEANGQYHMIAAGEIYLANATTNYCLNCALKKGVLTTDRPTLEKQAAGRS